MNKLVSLNHPTLVSSAKTLYWLVGTMIILIAGASLFMEMSLSEMLSALNKHFGKTFLGLYLLLISLAIYALQKIWHSTTDSHYWSEVGLQAANGISTLALTFTLFGISMGIGSLSEQSLTPDNVENVISVLTAQFSLAFMTTVVGLPSAAVLRALIAINQAKHQR